MTPSSPTCTIRGSAPDDVVTAELWRDRLGVEATELARERYRHRQTVTGGAYEMVAVVWRLRRQAQ